MRNAVTAPLVLFVGWLTGALLAGCQTRAPPASALAEATCPDEMQDQVTVAASAVPLTVPPELVTAIDSTEHPGQVARRVILSVAPKATAHGARLFSSTLTIATVGGTFTGWAAFDRNLQRSEAMDIIAGRLRLQPFTTSATLQAQTLTIDVLVTPGSKPLDELAIATSSLYSSPNLPTQPNDLRLTFTPVRHMTVFDVVNARVNLDVIAAPARSARELWHCSYANRFELIDHESVLPNAWGLRLTGRRGKEDQWLALNDPNTGPFRAVFTNPESARGFSNWLRTTRATRVDNYPLGLFQLDGPDVDTPPPAKRTIAVPFHGISPDELQVLEVKRLGE